MALFDLFRRTPKQIAIDFWVEKPDGSLAVRARHRELLARATLLGLDPGTILLLLQFFGPLIQALLEKLLARLEAKK